MSRCTVAVCDHCDLIIWPGEEYTTYPLAMLQSIDMHKSCAEKVERKGFNTAAAGKARMRTAENIKVP